MVEPALSLEMENTWQGQSIKMPANKQKQNSLDNLEENHMLPVKILGISSSVRADSATLYSVDEALKEAAKLPNVSVELVSLRGKKIAQCSHCNYCVKNNALCCIHDDHGEIYKKFIEADGYIIGSPIYQAGITPNLMAFFSRIRQTGNVYGDILVNRVGGVITTGGTRNGGHEVANMVVHNFFTSEGILVTGGPDGNYTGACVWSQDKGSKGAMEDEIGMGRVRGLGRRVAIAALELKNGKAILEQAGINLNEENPLWAEKKAMFAAGELD